MKLSAIIRPRILTPSARTTAAPAAATGHLAHRPVRRATPPGRRGLHWLAMRATVANLFRRKFHIGPLRPDGEFGYRPQSAPHHAAAVLNRMAGARLRPDGVLRALHVAAGSAGTPEQKNFDKQFDHAIKNTLTTLNPSDLYRLHARLRGPMRHYDAALRNTRTPDTPAAVSRAMVRTAEHLIRLDAAVVGELRGRGYDVPLKEHAKTPPDRAARRAADGLRSFAAGRHAAGEGEFSPEHRETIARGLRDIVRTDAIDADDIVQASDGSPFSVSRQFAIDLPRQDVILQNGTDPDVNFWDALKDEPDDALRNDNMVRQLAAQCNGNAKQAFNLSLLLTQATTKDPYTLTAINRPEMPGVIDAPFFSGENALLGQTQTTFTVRPSDDDGAVDVLMACRLLPKNAQIDADIVPLDDRQSVVDFSLAFRLPPAGPPTLQDARYRYSLSL